MDSTPIFFQCSHRTQGNLLFCLLKCLPTQKLEIKPCRACRMCEKDPYIIKL